MLLDLEDRGPQIGEPRPITEGDLEELRSAPKAPAPERKKLGYKHHALARTLASGQSERVAGMICGFAPSTVSILKGSPAFRDLMKFYATEDGKGFDAVRSQMLGVGQQLIEEIERRVTEDPESIHIKDLRETATLLLDRAGYGPAQSHEHEVHIHAGLADALKASRVHAPFPALPERGSNVIDAEYEELPTPDASPEAVGREPSDSPTPDGSSIFEWDEP